VNIWNSLPNSVVYVDTVNLLKARLDKFWLHQDVRYDFMADLTSNLFMKYLHNSFVYNIPIF